MRLIFLLFINLSITSLFASKVTAITNGNWNNDSTWDNTHPGCYDTICIPDGITVTLTSNENLEACTAMLIFVDGVLEFQTGRKLRLPCGDTGFIIKDVGSITVGGGGGASTFIEICGDQVWNAGMGDLSGPFILSADIMSFNAEVKNNFVEIEWMTSSERNNHKFIIEHSTNFSDWDIIEVIKGAGNSSVKLSYESTHTVPRYGINYYRIIQIDFDGNREYYPPISVMHINPNEKPVLFPNPSTEKHRTVQLQNAESTSVNIRIFSSVGELIYDDIVPLDNNKNAIFTLPAHTIKGIYFMEINGSISKLVLN